jgi:hypothetical protein
MLEILAGLGIAVEACGSIRHSSTARQSAGDNKFGLYSAV